MSSNIHITGWYLENRTGTHNKFYLVLLGEDGTLVTNWGRIGTTGQSNVVKYSSADEARDLALRQVYSKKAKGYEARDTDVKFSVISHMVNEASRSSNPAYLVRAFFNALRAPTFEGDKKAVAKHYEDFVAKAQRLMDGASDRPFEEVYGDFEELEEAWRDIHEKHGRAETTIGLTRQMLQQRLMGGAL